MIDPKSIPTVLTLCPRCENGGFVGTFDGEKKLIVKAVCNNCALPYSPEIFKKYPYSEATLKRGKE